MSNALDIDAEALTGLIAGIFGEVGVPDEAAAFVAASLVEADRDGIPSHGAMLVPMYVDRIRQGSIGLETEGVVVSDAVAGCPVVL